jgi:Reverse transcriptase (RNA-dependent DNA polymerase)
MDHYCYFKIFDGAYIILLLYVDDMLIACASMKEINILKQELASKFAMKDLGPIN